ncbi:MAG: helix-turn-helix domain-containing protein [Micromonosporaceae bacterium]|nr:helix-turn-helix domain-containing protein [Micromonosporaceae bacterium]
MTSTTHPDLLAGLAHCGVTACAAPMAVTGSDATRVYTCPCGLRAEAGDLEETIAARTLLAAPENSVSSIARLLSVSRTTLYKYVRELSATGAFPTLAASPASLPEQTDRESPRRQSRCRLRSRRGARC